MYHSILYGNPVCLQLKLQFRLCTPHGEGDRAAEGGGVWQEIWMEGAQSK